MPARCKAPISMRQTWAPGLKKMAHACVERYGAGIIWSSCNQAQVQSVHGRCRPFRRVPTEGGRLGLDHGKE